MAEKTLFMTRTMAKVHADQGNFDKAAEIYRHIHKLAPEHAEVAAELAAVEKKAADKHADRLAVLFEKWFTLAFARNRLRKLKSILPAVARGEDIEPEDGP